jgi:hypothetical protein
MDENAGGVHNYSSATAEKIAKIFDKFNVRFGIRPAETGDPGFHPSFRQGSLG